MASTSATQDYDSYDDEQDYDSDRPMERWAPLGAVSNPEPAHSHSEQSSHIEELQRLEEEQEQLNSSLLALTTHFAQVQFRLKQIVSADNDDKEKLLKELEEFAFRGIPDVRGCKVQDAQILEEMSNREHELKLSEQREKQRELILQLKSQLEDLETYAYETGESQELPTSKQIEKHKVVLDQLKTTLDLDMEKIDKFSTEELRQVVDHAVGQIVNPAKVKEKLVTQLKTQVTDLERFIDFLQGEATSPGPLGKERCTCPVHGQSDKGKSNVFSFDEKTVSKDRTDPGLKQSKAQETHLKLLRKTMHMLQIFLITQLGCGSRDFKKNAMKKTPKGNHWGDLRARLEVAIDKVSTAAKYQPTNEDEDKPEYNSDSEESQEMSSPLLTQTVRKDLAMAIRDLAQHGLMELGQSSSLVPWGCLSARSAAVTRDMHAWDLLLKYYELKHGQEYNESPARKLSQSFHLEIVGGRAITSKQTLLGAINTVITTHTPLKRSEDSHFKAFICMALNEGKLTQWLKLVFRTQTLVDNYYQDWSYVARTGFDDALKSMDKLNAVKFRLPVDLAVRPFSNIKDAF